MKKLNKNLLAISLSVILLIALAFRKPSAQLSFKCLVQLTNYTADGVYVVVSLLDAKGKYIKTLQVFGKEKPWYDDIPTWFSFYSTSKENIDGVTGASIKAGSRKVFALNIDENFYNKDYKIRFESSVEDQYYKEKDVEFDFSQNNIGKNLDGTGYIRYIKIFKNP